MQPRWGVALLVALALSACENADEAAAPAMEQAREAAAADETGPLPAETETNDVAATAVPRPEAATPPPPGTVPARP